MCVEQTMILITSCSHNFLLSKPTNNKAISQTQTRSSSSPLTSTKTLCLSRRSTVASMAGRSKFLEFPHASGSVRKLMVELVSMVEDRLGSQLLPCSLPEDVQFYQSESGNSESSLQIRSASHSSQIDLILGSWLHFADVSTGGKLDISCLYTYLNSKTDAPNFIIEVIESSPTSMALILDLPPRKDLILHPQYLKEFYEDTNLDVHRQTLYKLPEVKPYLSPSLHIRSVVSPTAVFANVKVEKGGAERMDEIVNDHVYPVAVELLKVWLDMCALEVRNVAEDERRVLEKRDGLVKNRGIEIDLKPNLPRLFGQETADRVIAAIKDVFNRNNQP